jgi:hypothetical protein
MKRHGQQPFSWGASSDPEDLTSATDVRRQYIVALRYADEHAYEPLLHFVRL